MWTIFFFIFGVAVAGYFYHKWTSTAETLAQDAEAAVAFAATKASAEYHKVTDKPTANTP